MGEASREIIEMVRDFKERAQGKHGLKKVVLFGSHATGCAGKESDIDLLVIVDGFKGRADMMSKLSREWHITQKKKMPVDFACFTSKEYDKLSKHASIVRQALQEGITI